MVLSYKPLVEHFRLAVKRKDSRHGQVPVTVLTALDTKIMSQCKSIDHLAEISAAFAAALVSMAVSASPSLQLSADGLWISRTNPFSEKVVIELLHHREDLNVQAGFYTKTKLQFKAINIPASAERAVTAIELTVDEDAYYLDVLAQELGVPDAGHVLMTRAITKAPSGARLYSPLVKMPPNILVPTRTPLDTQWIGAVGKDCMLQATCCHPEGTTKNERASFLIGHPIHGNAILACVGSSWQSEGKCDCSDITLNLYHRLMLGRSPRGAYKLSRQSALVPDLPTVYNCRTQWRGAYPRSLLTDFFQQHHLPEPRFVCTYPASDSDGGSCDLEDSKQVDSNNGSINQKDAKDHQSEAVAQGPFRYAVWVTSDGGQNSMFFESQGYHKTRYDASQSAALKVMAHYSTWCDANIPGYVGTQKPLNYLKSSEDDHCKSVECQAVKNNATINDPAGMTSNISTSVGLSAIKDIEYQVVAEDDEVGGTPPAGSMVSVSFSVHMVKDAAGCTSSGRNDNIDNIILEEQSEFEFELGTGAVIGEFEVCVINARVGQTLSFLSPAPPVNFLLATQDKLSQPVCGDGLLKYTVKLNKYMEAPEERMESAHFSPPLSKQRNEFARNIIKALEPKFLLLIG
ncbi:hypothetical protein CY35_01G060500 [Sphagnum magellanicum]|nr:hypothetical protein CY35_01G060500 [Sphagnum magellanicum]